MTNSNQKQISNHLLSEIKNSLESVQYGSIEIFVQNRVVTQITVRNIHKTSVEIEKEDGVSISADYTTTNINSSQIKTNTNIRKNPVNGAVMTK